jgi:hypothetical protein
MDINCFVKFRLEGVAALLLPSSLAFLVGCPTQRALDAGDSGAIPSSFLRLVIFPIGRLRAVRPSASNANRWAVPCTTMKKQKAGG